MNKQRFLKSILATSALAAVLLPAQSALGAAARTTAGAATLSTGVGLDGGGAVAFVTGSTLQHTGAHTVNIDIDGVNVQAIDANGQGLGASPISVTKNATIGSIGDGAGGGAAAPMTIAAGVTATFSGTAGAGYVANVYTDLGATTIGAANFSS
jgi:hypothetical protein